VKNLLREPDRELGGSFGKCGNPHGLKSIPVSVLRPHLAAARSLQFFSDSEMEANRRPTSADFQGVMAGLDGFPLATRNPVMGALASL
jgi:hypothetical protein